MVDKNHPDDALDSTLAALADPTRREIFRLLLLEEQRVGDLAAPFEMSLNAVSKHIKKLEAAGLVSRRKVGREHYLTADPRALEAPARWIEDARAFWRTRLDRLETLIKEEARNE